MFKKLSLFFFLIINLMSQTATDIQYELVTESITIGDEPYMVQVELQVQSSREIDLITLNFDSLNSQMHLVAAVLNGQDLWLVRREDKAANDKVLAWMFDDTDKQLVIYPDTWSAPYQLVLDIQVTLMRNQPVSSVLQMAAQINNSKLPCQTVGRGNSIRFTR